MLRIAICDDQPDQIQSIRRSSETYFQNKHDTVSYETFDKSFSFVDAIEQGAVFDIVLLDVFLTTSDEFAVDAFAVKATDYLLKPFTQSQFNKAMDRAISFIRQRNSAKIVLRLVGGGICIEEIAQILYFESSGHILRVHLADGTVLETRKSGQEMKDALDKIAPGQFASPNKGYLVNLAAVHVIKSDYVEIAGQEIPLGKRKYREFQELYFQFMFSVKQA